MPATELLVGLPVSVVGAVQELAEDPDTREVWLIGSRASNTQHATSDWDLLLRSSREPAPVLRRHTGIDVLHCGPSGTTLLEGQPMSMAVQFSTLLWEVVSSVEAKYSGIKFLPVPEGVVLNSTQPSVVRVPAKGRLLWSR
jgi:hypothetical protein